MTTEGDVPANQGYDEEPDVQPEIETPVIQYEPPAEPQQPYVPPVAMVPSQPPTMPPAHAAITQQTMIGYETFSASCLPGTRAHTHTHTYIHTYIHTHTALSPLRPPPRSLVSVQVLYNLCTMKNSLSCMSPKLIVGVSTL